MQVEEKLKQQQMPAEKKDDFRINCFHERRETCLKGTIISVFVTRYEENKNDIPFFESLIQNKILSQDEIKKQLKEQDIQLKEQGVQLKEQQDRIRELEAQVAAMSGNDFSKR